MFLYWKFQFETLLDAWLLLNFLLKFDSKSGRFIDWRDFYPIEKLLSWPGWESRGCVVDLRKSFDFSLMGYRCSNDAIQLSGLLQGEQRNLPHFILWMIQFRFKVVQEYERAVIFRLGRLVKGGAKGPGVIKLLCTRLCIQISFLTQETSF